MPRCGPIPKHGAKSKRSVVRWLAHSWTGWTPRSVGERMETCCRQGRGALMAEQCRGEVGLADLGAARGHEQAGRRSILIFSVDTFNAGPAGLVIVLPFTSTI